MPIFRRCARCRWLYYELNHTGKKPKKYNGFMLLHNGRKMIYCGRIEHNLCPDCMEELMAWLDAGKDCDEG